MNFGEISSFVIIGGGQTAFDITKYVFDLGHDVKVITSPRHSTETMNSGETFEAAVNSLPTDCVVTDNINSDFAIEELVNECTFGLTIGPAWIFRKRVLEAFGGRMGNFHPVSLPKYRGGAHFTWQILQGDRVGGLNVQLIAPKLDAGAVIMTHNYNLDETDRRPVDYFNALDQNATPFLRDFIDKVLVRHEFTETLLKEEQSLYMPRLSTADQAYIDWSWSGTDILKFIDAFDDPYPGSRTFLNDQLVIAKSAELESTQEPFHSYQSGLIIRKHSNRIYVATTGGTLEISTLTTESVDNLIPTARLGDRLHTPIPSLEISIGFQARYDAHGVKT
jgi:methionyl-tRNA formyltransferase